MIYRTKVDAWLPITMLLSILLPVGIGVYILMTGDGPAAIGWLIIAFTVPPFGIVAFMAWPMTYDTGAARADGEPILLVRSGLLLRYEVPIAEIREVRPSRNPTSAPAWSLDRLEILSRTPSGFRGSLLISPKDRDGFLDDLVRRAGNLDREGDRLLRRDEAPAAP